IIKENRTYDQVLGDMKGGAGDPNLCLFPEKITPNQHAISRDFTLFDHFYVAAEVSADGHNWSTAAYANDYTEKTWIQSYGFGGGDYVYEGQRQIAWPRDGFIWDHCKRAGIPFRTYGEFADDYKANYPTLEKHFCPYFTSWDTKVLDTMRVKQWARDFDSLVAINQLPRLNTLRFINDHTEGLRKDAHTPIAMVADNDLAVGQFIEYLSKSPVWKESAVFILEDDAQDGADHIDAHRSTAYVVSPYTRRNFVDSTPYTTNSMLRTIELILGLPPMSQHDAAATPMWRCFTNKPDFRPYKAIPSNINLDDRNAGNDNLSRQFDYFDFAKEDKVPDLEFNQLLWKAMKGEDSEMPAPKRAAWVIEGEKGEE
ncbi:MAG: alkaline phosphatase family protein, partial [Bacteroidota bacterium]